MQKAIIEYSTSATKTASKIVGHKGGEVIGNKIVDAVTRSNDDKIEKQEPAGEIIIPPEKRSNINQIEKSIIKMKHYKILSY